MDHLPILLCTTLCLYATHGQYRGLAPAKLVFVGADNWCDWSHPEEEELHLCLEALALPACTCHEDELDSALRRGRLHWTAFHSGSRPRAHASQNVNPSNCAPPGQRGEVLMHCLVAYLFSGHAIFCPDSRPGWQHNIVRHIRMITNWAMSFSHYKNRGFRRFFGAQLSFCVYFVSSYLPIS